MPKKGRRNMEFFDKLGKKASEAYKMTADKTGKIAKETKMKLKIGELKSQITEIYEDIGKKVYEKQIRKEESIEKEIEEKCIKIDVLSDEIEGLLKQCLELKDKKQCPKCYKEIEKDVKFCPNCGEKQKVEETEEKTSNSNQQEENNNENQEEQKQSNLEKTVAIEADVEIEENSEETKNEE